MLKSLIVLLAPCVLGTGLAAAQITLPVVPPAVEATEPKAAEADANAPGLETLDADAVNDAAFESGMDALKGARPLVLRTQILLDRAGTSPGVIDAFWGENVAKALNAYQEKNALPKTGRLDEATFAALVSADAQSVLVPYVITAEDVAGPFGPLPKDYSELAKLKSLHYESPLEMFAERFHMDTDLLAALNPGSAFAAGDTILVAETGTPIEGKETVTQLRADKRTGQLLALDASGTMVAAYPATIGSDATPSPSGDHKVSGIAVDPVYYYDPENFQQGDNTEKLELPPGPNSPVGTVWIDLTEPTYGIHGTPEPSKVDKTSSHGCVRLTNWDAAELAKLVKVGAVVAFID